MDKNIQSSNWKIVFFSPIFISFTLNKFVINDNRIYNKRQQNPKTIINLLKHYHLTNVNQTSQDCCAVEHMKHYLAVQPRQARKRCCFLRMYSCHTDILLEGSKRIQESRTFHFLCFHSLIILGIFLFIWNGSAGHKGLHITFLMTINWVSKGIKIYLAIWPQFGDCSVRFSCGQGCTLQRLLHVPFLAIVTSDRF